MNPVIWFEMEFAKLAVSDLDFLLHSTYKMLTELDEHPPTYYAWVFHKIGFGKRPIKKNDYIFCLQKVTNAKSFFVALWDCILEDVPYRHPSLPILIGKHYLAHLSLSLVKIVALQTWQHKKDLGDLKGFSPVSCRRWLTREGHLSPTIGYGKVDYVTAFNTASKLPYSTVGFYIEEAK